MKNAFTLIELLAVFILLAIIALITTSVILAVGKDSKESLYKTQKEMVIEAAKKWTIENEYKIDSSYNLTLEELYDDGYLKTKEIADPNEKNKYLCGDVEIRYEYSEEENKNKYIYIYEPQSQASCD